MLADEGQQKVNRAKRLPVIRDCAGFKDWELQNPNDELPGFKDWELEHPDEEDPRFRFDVAVFKSALKAQHKLKLQSLPRREYRLRHERARQNTQPFF